MLYNKTKILLIKLNNKIKINEYIILYKNKIISIHKIINKCTYVQKKI